MLSVMGRRGGWKRPSKHEFLQIRQVALRAVVTALNAIYEGVSLGFFLGFLHGFRPGRERHDALDALCVAIKVRLVDWALDADIKRLLRRGGPHVVAALREAPRR